MAVFETWLESDLQKPVNVKRIPGAVFSQDNMANKVGVIVTDGGEPVALAGTVYGYVIIPTGETVEIEGAIEDTNRAFFLMPQDCYVNGHISIVIKLTSGETITTLGACTAYVYKSKTGEEVVPEGTPIPDLSLLMEQIDAAMEQVEEVVESIPEDYTNLANDVEDLKSAIDELDGGTTGQVLRKKSNTDLDVEWASVAQPTDAQVAEAVDDWLDDHPEATTTVEDGSLTEAKFTAQTIIDYKNYVATPQMYGAVGNGSHDDTEAIQAAVNAHRKVYFPQGTYKITSPITIAHGHTIEGDSKYETTIWSYGCDCIQMTAGDNGERGTIRNIHLRGDYTEDSKGIVLASNASGWTIVDVWMDSFDYGIYGFKVGNVNNIYIDKCIITGKLQGGHWHDMHAGIHLANSTSGQVNAIVIRDCEINYFEKGVIIGGTANSIMNSTIQACEYGIYLDPALGEGTVGTPMNTNSLIISGNYMELIDKNCIYIRADYENGIGLICGLQITSNYLYKANGSNNSYAVIKLDPGTYGSYGRQPNAGGSAGLKFANVFIGMNSIIKPSACKAYDMKNCLGQDSLIMDATSGGTTTYNFTRPYGIGANMFFPMRAKEKLNFNFYKYSLVKDPSRAQESATGQVNSDMTSFTFDANMEMKVCIPNKKIYQVTYDAEASEYPFKIFGNHCVRSNKDGLLYNTYANIDKSSALVANEGALVGYGRGWQEKSQATSGFTAAYLPTVDVDHGLNDVGDLILVFYAYTNGITVKNIMIEYYTT